MDQRWILGSISACVISCGGIAAESSRDEGDSGSNASAIEDAGEILRDLDAPCGPNAITGRQILNQLALSYSDPFIYGDDSDASPTTTATFTVAYDAGAITCILSSRSCSPGGKTGCGFSSDPADVDLAVNVTFQTSDGAFNEHLAATASWGGNSIEGVGILADVAPSAIVGTFAPTGNPQFVEFNLRVSMLEDGGVSASGAIDGLVGSNAVEYGSFGY
jgi:hypothetical protein